ncbi:MAG TPA: anti-sigma factor [Tepidisphaeraceae bacterium]|nr:anti-sigma factor [Tepidisphaeraceae bacterium]
MHIDRIDAYHDAALNPSDMAWMKEHLRTCPPCADRLRQIEQISQLFADTAQDVMPFPAKSRLLSTVRAAVDRAPSRFAWEMTGIAASVLVAATIWLATVPSSAQAGANWERAAATGGRSLQITPSTTQPTETQFASWVVSDLSENQTQEQP